MITQNQRKSLFDYSNNLTLVSEGVSNGAIKIPPFRLNELLKLYPLNERMVENISYYENTLFAELIPRDINYSNAKPDYFTAVQLLEAFSQLGYILGGMYFLDDSIPEMPSEYYSTYLQSIEALKCYYTELNFTFKKKILKCDTQIIKFYATDLMCTKSKILIYLKAYIGKSFFADAKLFCSLDNKEIQ